MYKIENQERYREIIYSGGALNSATLTINDIDIPTSQIKSIKFSSPIIDTTQDYFYIGTFNAQKVEITFKNADEIDLNGIVYISINTNVDSIIQEIPSGYYLIDTTPENYYKTATITCYDKSILFKTNIDISQFFDEDKQITAENLLKALCNYYLGENMLGTYPDINRNVTTALYDNSKSGKYYISHIAEIMGGNAKLGRDGKLYIVPLKSKPVTTIDALKSKSWEMSSHYKISRVFYENLTRKYEYGDETDNSLNIRSENVFVNDNVMSADSIIENLYNALNGFEIYAIKTENYGDPTLDCWDIVNYDLDGTIYPSFYDNTLTYEQNIMSKVEVKIPSKQKAEVTNVLKNENKQLYDISVTIDQVNGEIKQTIQTAEEAKQKADSVEKNLKDNYSTTTEMNNTIDQKITDSENSITTALNETIKEAKQDAIDSANSSTDDKLKSYSTTTEMNNTITQKITDSENSIQASVSEQIKDSEGNILKDVDGKLELKLDKKDLFSEFNVNVDQVRINSKNFKLDENGHVEANDLLLTGGKLDLIDDGTEENASMKITKKQEIFGYHLKEGMDLKDRYLIINPGIIGLLPENTTIQETGKNIDVVLLTLCNPEDETETADLTFGSANYQGAYAFDFAVGNHTIYEFVINNGVFTNPNEYTRLIMNYRGFSFKNITTTKIKSINKQNFADLGIKSEIISKSGVLYDTDEIVDNIYCLKNDNSDKYIELNSYYSSSGITTENIDKYNYNREDWRLAYAIKDKISILTEPLTEQKERYYLNNSDLIEDDIQTHIISITRCNVSDGKKISIKVNSNNFNIPILIESEDKSFSSFHGIRKIGAWYYTNPEHSEQYRNSTSSVTIDSSTGFSWNLKEGDIGDYVDVGSLGDFGGDTGLVAHNEELKETGRYTANSAETGTLTLRDEPYNSNHAVRLKDLDNVDKSIGTLFYNEVSTNGVYSFLPSAGSYTDYRFLFILQEATGVNTLIPVVYIQNIAQYHSLVGIDNTNHNIFTRLHFTGNGFECVRSAYALDGETLYDNPYKILIVGIK